MSQEAIEAIVDIADWYASPGGTFIRVFGRENPTHVLPRYATDKLIMQEVSYHLAIGLLARLHRKTKVTRPTLPLRIRLYEIKILKYVDVEAKEIIQFEFGIKEFILYDPCSIQKDHYMRVYFPWINREFHWIEEDPWRYYYNASKLIEMVSIPRNWKAPPWKTSTPKVKTLVLEGINLVQQKGKRNIVDDP